MMDFVCLDTQILIWGVKRQSEEGQEEMIKKAISFFKWLDKNDINSIIPTVVIGELLIRVPSEKHNEVISFFQKNFIIGSYDIAAASCFAKIWRDKKEDGTFDGMHSPPNSTRTKLKADCQIVAIAITKKASCIYSYDKDVEKFGEGYIDVKKMPNITEQQELPF
jgi:hypothetical protein